MFNPNFLTADDVLFFHASEMALVNAKVTIRDRNQLDAAINAPKATFDGNFLMDIFGMAATYITAICTHHPFLDGNKRVAAISALVFLDINGYGFKEKYEEELADIIISFVTKKISKDDLVRYLKKRCRLRVYKTDR